MAVHLRLSSLDLLPHRGVDVVDLTHVGQGHRHPVHTLLEQHRHSQRGVVVIASAAGPEGGQARDDLVAALVASTPSFPCLLEAGEPGQPGLNLLPLGPLPGALQAADDRGRQGALGLAPLVLAVAPGQTRGRDLGCGADGDFVGGVIGRHGGPPREAIRTRLLQNRPLTTSLTTALTTPPDRPGDRSPHPLTKRKAAGQSR